MTDDELADKYSMRFAITGTVISLNSDTTVRRRTHFYLPVCHTTGIPSRSNLERTFLTVMECECTSDSFLAIE